MKHIKELYPRIFSHPKPLINLGLSSSSTEGAASTSPGWRAAEPWDPIAPLLQSAESAS